MSVYTPPAAFAFNVAFDLGGATASDARFSEVSGLSQELTVETLTEGGENRFVHKLPGRAVYPNLVLRRGLLTDSGLIGWLRDTFETMTIVPVTVWVSLLDSAADPLATWTVESCWPVKWSVGAFNAGESTLAIETLELAYARFRRS